MMENSLRLFFRLKVSRCVCQNHFGVCNALHYSSSSTKGKAMFRFFETVLLEIALVFPGGVTTMKNAGFFSDVSSFIIQFYANAANCVQVRPCPKRKKFWSFPSRKMKPRNSSNRLSARISSSMSIPLKRPFCDCPTTILSAFIITT